MTDPINTYSRPLGTPGVNGNRSASRQEGSKDISDPGTRITDTSFGARRPVLDEKLELSETARRSMADPSFDRAKVDAIKAALREGNYPLDSRRIAESFVALERLVDN